MANVSNPAWLIAASHSLLNIVKTPLFHTAGLSGKYALVYSVGYSRTNRMKNVLMLRIAIAFGISALVSLGCFAQAPASSQQPACPPEAVCTPYIGGPDVNQPSAPSRETSRPPAPANRAVANRCQIPFAEQAQPEVSFPACNVRGNQQQRLSVAALRLPVLPGDAASGSPARDSNTAEASLPDAASSTRIALIQSDAPSGRGDRTPIAVYPIRFPYTAREKFGLFVRDIYDPFNFMAEGFNALWEQSQGVPHEYGGGGPGYGRRLGAMVGTDIVGEFTGTFLFPSIFHTDPRYFRMARGSLKRRFFYAVSRQLITKNDSGDDTFNTAKLLSGLATTAVSNSYYPRRDRSFPGIVQHTLVNMGFDALNDAFREFWPDVAHGLHIPAFVIRRTADPTFVDPMDPRPMPMTPPDAQPSTQPPADDKNPAPANPGLPKNLQ